jgi:hypothetical protein
LSSDNDKGWGYKVVIVKVKVIRGVVKVRVIR